jgi:hypothetical protein
MQTSREAAAAISRSASHGLEILGGRFAGLAVDHDLERDALTFFQFAQASAFDSADVDEHVLAATFGLDESITLLRVEPLNGSVAHGALLFRNKRYEPREMHGPGSLEILVKDRQSGALIVAARPSHSAENSMPPI